MILNKDYILPCVAGRMGNNMFMIANAFAKAVEYNKQVVVYKQHVLQGDYDYSKNIFRKVDFTDEYDDNRNYNPLVPSDDKHSMYVGYYQSEEYFEKYSELIKFLFEPTYDFIKEIYQKLPFLNEEVTVISVRKGYDYLGNSGYHPTISLEYIYEALKYIPDNQHYLIMSDNIEWCKENIKLENSSFCEGFLPHEQMWIMSLCHHYVISNSSFSWWGAYLSRNVDKVVVAPETWFGPDFRGTWNNMYCKGWIVMPTYFENGLILPKNDLSTDINV